MKFGVFAAASVLALSGMPAHAEENLVKSAEPETLISALESAGYSSVLSKDDVGDPLINVELHGQMVQILFYDCDEDTHDGCGAIQLSVGFDRKEPMDPAAALALARQLRFIAVSLDETGDPFLQWDIITGNGVAAPVFLKSIRRFGQSMAIAGRKILEE